MLFTKAFVPILVWYWIIYLNYSWPYSLLFLILNPIYSFTAEYEFRGHFEDDAVFDTNLKDLLLAQIPPPLAIAHPIFLSSEDNPDAYLSLKNYAKPKPCQVRKIFPQSWIYETVNVDKSVAHQVLQIFVVSVSVSRLLHQCFTYRFECACTWELESDYVESWTFAFSLDHGDQYYGTVLYTTSTTFAFTTTNAPRPSLASTDAVLESVPLTVRKDFPETWIWDALEAEGYSTYTSFDFLCFVDDAFPLKLS